MPELLDASFQVVRARFWELALVALIITGPALALELVASEDMLPLAQWLENFLGNYVTAASVIIVSDAYLGREADIRGALSRTGRRAGSIFGAAWMRGLMIGIGILLCVVPGIIAMIVTFAMPMAVMLEGATASAAFDRSRALARDQWGRITLAYVLAFLLAFIAAIGLGVVVELAGGPEIVGRLVEMLSSVLFAPLVAVVGTLLYYDLRIRKEGFDIEMLAAELGSLGPAEPPASAY